jgi:hypothetical protein
MAVYAGLSPQDALAKWYNLSHRVNDPTLTPEEVAANKEGGMVTLARENPAAWKAVATGINDNGSTRQVFDPNTGQWVNQDVHGFWSHPESWIQLAAGAGLGGVAAAPALAAAGGGAAGGGGGAAAGGAAAGALPSTAIALPAASTALPVGAASATPAISTALGAGAAGAGAAGAGGGAAGGGSILGTANTIGRILGPASTASKALSPVLSGAAAGANQSQQANDLLQLRLAALGLEAPQQRLSNSVRASIAANAQPVQITTGPSPFAHAPTGSNMIHFTNSLSPAVLAPGTRQLAQAIIAQQLQQQMSPNQGLPAVGQGSTAGNILGGAALGAGVLGALGTLGKKPVPGANPSGVALPGVDTSIDPSQVNPVDLSPYTGVIDPSTFNDPGLL